MQTMLMSSLIKTHLTVKTLDGEKYSIPYEALDEEVTKNGILIVKRYNEIQIISCIQKPFTREAAKYIKVIADFPPDTIVKLLFLFKTALSEMYKSLFFPENTTEETIVNLLILIQKIKNNFDGKEVPSMIQEMLFKITAEKEKGFFTLDLTQSIFNTLNVDYLLHPIICLTLTSLLMKSFLFLNSEDKKRFNQINEGPFIFEPQKIERQNIAISNKQTTDQTTYIPIPMWKLKELRNHENCNIANTILKNAQQVIETSKWTAKIQEEQKQASSNTDIILISTS